jgi:hypothetical protein
MDLGWCSVACLPEHRDLLPLFKWSHEQQPDIQHIVNGIMLGYPLPETEHWVACNCPGKSLQEMLQEEVDEPK